MQEVVISNLPPVWVLWMGYGGMLLFGLSSLTIAFMVWFLAQKASRLMDSINVVVDKDIHQDVMPNVNVITKNIATISDDVARTTTSATSAAANVTNLIGEVTGSPVVKVAGVAGLMLGAVQAVRSKQAGKKVPTKQNLIPGILRLFLRF